MNTVQYSKTLPVKYDVDVCVIGGGPAGVAAGVTAARHGAKTLIVESAGFFGGAATTALVPAFMRVSNGVAFMAGGIGKEVYDRVCIPELRLSLRLEVLKREYDAMVRESGADFLFFSNMIDVIPRENGIDGIVVAAKSGIYVVHAKVYVDASGDGDVCVRAGAPYELGDANGHVMPSTLCSMWINIDWDKIDKTLRDNRECDRAIADGVFTQEDYHLSGIWRTGNNTGGGNISHCYNVNATDERSLTDAMVLGRKILPEFERYYREYLDEGYRNASIYNTGSALGVRESRRIMGDYVLGMSDFRADSFFEDEIGRYSYPVDVHPELGKENYQNFLKEHRSLDLGFGESYSIPYRCLLPKTLDNVYVAGRCISVDQKMQSSIRVMPGCFITGQACGLGAALAASGDGDIRRISISELQDKLAAMGAWLPNHK